MAKQHKKKDDFGYEITEVIGTLSPNADLHSDWCKSVLRSLMGDNNEEGIDIRRYNSNINKMGPGIRLSIPEANELVDLLLKNGYGSLSAIEEEYNKRKSLYE